MMQRLQSAGAVQAVMGLVVVTVGLTVFRARMVSLPSRPPSLTGFIVKVGANGVAVGRTPPQVDDYAEISPSTQIVDGRTKPRRRVNKEALFSGLKVNLWQTSVQESYPSRSRVSHIEIVTP
jgi:hypothetical protein